MEGSPRFIQCDRDHRWSDDGGGEGSADKRTHVVSFEVEVREVDGDAVLIGRDDLPDAVLVRRIQFRERRTLNGSVSGIDVSSARVCYKTCNRSIYNQFRL